jgi:hypothetical protein
VTSGSVEVEVVGDADAAREFWQAFASIAADLLDEGQPPGEPLAPEEAA